MFDLYYWPTPNGHKITLFLEEAGLEYRLVPVDIGRGAQFEPDFLRISPNNRMPALVDHAPADRGAPLSVFESGAILEYLADKTQQFIPGDVRGRVETLQWLYWQVAGLGPMAGQNHHFARYAPEPIPYAIERYVRETARLYAVLDRRLADREYINGRAYSIADMASYPWIERYEPQQQNLDDFPALKRWYHAIHDRAATVRAYARADDVTRRGPVVDEASRQFLFGQGAETVRPPGKPRP